MNLNSFSKASDITEKAFVSLSIHQIAYVQALALERIASSLLVIEGHLGDIAHYFEVVRTGGTVRGKE